MPFKVVDHAARAITEIFVRRKISHETWQNPSKFPGVSGGF